MKLIKEAELTDGGEIRCMDVTSLYYFVNKYKPLSGQCSRILPEVNPSSLPKYFGFVKCSILPPRYLYHPALSVRHNEKLLFPLCMTCGKELQIVALP